MFIFLISLIQPNRRDSFGEARVNSPFAIGEAFDCSKINPETLAIVSASFGFMGRENFPAPLSGIEIYSSLEFVSTSFFLNRGNSSLFSLLYSVPALLFKCYHFSFELFFNVTIAEMT